MDSARVAVLFGSDSDWSVMKSAVEQLRAFDVQPLVEVVSAHRTPERAAELASGAAERGIEVIIAGAGLAAALPGVIAAHTHLPVIGVPLASGSLQGVDALLSIAQMPPGVPVACVGIGSAGARNAALLAVEILAAKDQALADRYRAFREEQSNKVAEKNRKLQEQL